MSWFSSIYQSWKARQEAYYDLVFAHYDHLYETRVEREKAKENMSWWGKWATHWAESTCYGAVPPQLAPMMMAQYSIKRQVDDHKRRLDRIERDVDECSKNLRSVRGDLKQVDEDVKQLNEEVKRQGVNWEEVRRQVEVLHWKMREW